MVPSSPKRRNLKRIGVVLSLLILTAWMATFFWEYSSLPSQRTYWSISGGRLYLVTARFNISAQFPPPHGLRRSGPVFNDLRNMGLVSPELGRRGYKTQVGSPPKHDWVFQFPFWLPLLLTAIPTAWLWHRDRRRSRSGCCLRCGYDLTGNTSGVCPECGDKVHPPVVLADSECGERVAKQVDAPTKLDITP